MHVMDYLILGRTALALPLWKIHFKTVANIFKRLRELEYVLYQSVNVRYKIISLI